MGIFFEKRIRPVLCGLLIMTIICLTGCSVSYEDYSAAGTVMGTVFSAGFRANGKGSGEAVWKKLTDDGARLEQEILSRRIDSSEIAALNASAGNEEGFEVSPELEYYLRFCISVSEESGGAFDITVGALSRLWSIDEAALNPGSFVLPSQEDIEQASANIGYTKMRIDNHRVYIPEGMSIDLGAVGKGIYLDDALEILQENCTYGVISAGGSILTCGYRAGGDKWKIGIANPDGGSEVVATLLVEGNAFISTSGDYERFVEYENVRYHHILDPRTGYPADSGLCSVSVVVPGDIEDGGLLSDALTTAIFVLGEAEGMKLAESYGAGVLLVRNDGTVAVSDIMKKYTVQ